MIACTTSRDATEPEAVLRRRCAEEGAQGFVDGAFATGTRSSGVEEGGEVFSVAGG